MIAYLEYYQGPFILFHDDLRNSGYEPLKHHEVAASFWGIVPPGHYDSESARPIIQQYLSVLEQRLSDVIRRHSIGYWLHAYRRLFPGPIGGNDSDATVYLVRSTFEAAVQKYGSFDVCSGVGFSDQVDPSRIFKGLMMAPEFARIRELLLKGHPQLVLTDFDSGDFKELYEMERLAYQVWRCGAALRTTGKGAGILVEPGVAGGFHDTRSDELDKLVESYDSREWGLTASATGTAFDSEFKHAGAEGVVLCAKYNVTSSTLAGCEGWLASLRIRVHKDSRPNFFWIPFKLRHFYRAHTPYASAFEKMHGIPLSWIFAVLCGLLLRVFVLWTREPTSFFRSWWRAYEGPHTREFVTKEISDALPLGIQSLGITIESNDVDVPAVIRFFEVTESKRETINLGTRGPLSIFLPFGPDRLFIDYAWIPQILFNLFFGVKMDNENFKGDALEELVRRGRSVLPVGPCKSPNGEERQIDASFEIGDTLLIVECRAFARSFGIETGDPQAIKFRTEKIELALKDVDEKASWLCLNPRGTNYDIGKFQRILPVAVTPFVEFIPSTAARYWLTDKLPRVLSPSELRDLLEDEAVAKLAGASANAVIVSRSH